MANITPTTAATFIPELWSGEIMRFVRRNLVMANLVKRFDADVKNGGDIIHIPRLAEVAARDKTAGTAVTFDAATESEYTLTVDKHKYFAFILEDITAVQARADLRKEYAQAAGHAIAKAADTSLTSLYSGLSQSVSGGAALDDADVLAAIEYLDIAEAPRDDRAFVIHAEAMSDLRSLARYTAYDNTGREGVQVGRNNGLVANVYGVDVYMSNNIVESAGTPNILHNLMFHKEAFGMAMQMAPKTEAEYSVDHLGWKVAAHEIYGVAEIRDSFAVDVQLNS